MVRTAEKKLKARKPTKIEPHEPNPAVTKELQRIAAELATDAAPMPLVKKLLATGAEVPYAPGEWQRSIAEIDALKALVAREEVEAGRYLWGQLAKQWAKGAPTAGHGYWRSFVRQQQALQAPVPSAPTSLRKAIAEAWALGVVKGRFEYQNGKLAATTPTDGSEAWRQACIAITQHDFTAARAAIAAVGAAYKGPDGVLEVVLRREEGDRDGAIVAFREHLARCLRRRRKESWAEVAGLYILIEMEDEDVADQILSVWDAKDADGREFFRLLAGR